MTRLRKSYLAATFAAILVEAGGLPAGTLHWVLKPVYGASDSADAGFSPGICPEGHPPPELLALADWPLDPASEGCRAATDTVVMVIPPPAAIDMELLSPVPADLAPLTPQDIKPVDIKVPVSPPPAPQSRNGSRDDTERPARVMPPPPTRQDPEPVLFSGTLVEDGALDGLRGGFETPGGLVMSFGVERLVYINGALTSMTRLNVADLGQLRGAGIDPAQLPSIGSTLAVIQNGPNNSFVAENLTNGAFATVIQNSLNNQRIQAVTTLNVTVNSLELMRANRLGESLRSAVSGAMIR